MIEDKDIKIGAIVEIEEKDFRLDTTRCRPSCKGLFRIAQLPAAPEQEVKLSPLLDSSLKFPADFFWSFPKDRLKEIATLVDPETIGRRFYIGIDPGAHGGIAVLDSGGVVVEVRKMPETPQDLLEFLRRYRAESFCTLERVGGMPGNGGSAMFNFGKGYGHLQMALLALGIPTEDVTPNKWEKSYQLGTSGKYTKTEWKNRLKGKAQQLFPSLGKRITLATCDALLIAEYGRRRGL